MNSGFHYLGFQIKLNEYKIIDWSWIIKKKDLKLKHWTFRWLSIGGRVILIKSVLHSLSVYWIHLYMFPMEIIHKIDVILDLFLCFDKESSYKIHLARLSFPAKVVDKGGWGIMDTLSFNRDLICKSLWRGLSCRGIWSHIIRGKYLAYQDYEVWIKGGAKTTLTFSFIWCSMMRQRLSEDSKGFICYLFLSFNTCTKKLFFYYGILLLFKLIHLIYHLGSGHKTLIYLDVWLQSGLSILDRLRLQAYLSDRLRLQAYLSQMR